MLRDHDAEWAAEQVGEYLQLGPAVEKESIQITEDIASSWQSEVDTLAEFCDVPAALIVRAHGTEVEILSSSRSNGNIYEAGSREPLAGLFCERVIRDRAPLLVANARADNAGEKNPDMQRGMTAYLGYPVLWPDGEIFGAISVLDSNENHFDRRIQRLMAKFKEHLEAHLKFRYKTLIDRMSLRFILDNIGDGIIVHDMNRRILYFNRSAEKITGYSRKEVVGKDCHRVFGSPFCGVQCSFCGENPGFTGSSEYSINFTSRDGESRKIEMTASMMTDEKGQQVGILAVFKDITRLFELQMTSKKLFKFGNIIGKDRKMREVFQQIRNVTDYNFPVHISGETGTGKELVAHAIHNESVRKGAPFVPINCGALPEGLIESELFGHVKGAFSGAIREKKGRFELAHSGTVFLDEVAELSKPMQVKLLRFLQEGTFERVGGERTISVDVRVISATNRNLRQEVQANRFRDDLFYRLNVIPIGLPPLRERRNDIPLLVTQFLKEASERHRQEIPYFSDEALRLLLGYPWPGNVRELQNAIQFAIVHAAGHVIQPRDLPVEIAKDNVCAPFRRGPAKKLDPVTVSAALAETAGNKTRAAKRLGVGRATLYRFLADHPELA
jgi:sigma-54 dependent transcriptional regulator, acetoin dehydrogenase operon transcriptional activator AcoR